MKHLKRITVLASLVLTIANPAFAKGKKPSAATAPAESYPSSSSHSTDIYWNVAGPFALLDGTALFGAFVSADYFITPVISVGGESGFLIGSSNSVTTWEIPIVPTGKYHFRIPSAPNLRPYAGLGIGLGILHSGASVTVAGVPVSASSTGAKFHFEVKGGTAFQDGPGLMAELRMGVVDGSFLFAPSIGWNF